MLLGLGELRHDLGAFLDLGGRLFRELVVEVLVFKVLVEALNLFVQFCRQGFDIVDLFLQRREVARLSALALRCSALVSCSSPPLPLFLPPLPLELWTMVARYSSRSPS
jgi:hypothetical protein